MTSIRHAIIALGALSESLNNAPAPLLKVNVIQEMDKKHQEQAVLQHIKAIQALNQYISSSGSPQLRSALITCLLFVCFEVFQGSIASSVQQTYGGLKILQSYYIGKSGSRPSKHQKPFPIQTRRSPNSDILSKTLETRENYDVLGGDRVIASHVEEYLESESSRWLGAEAGHQSPERASSEPAVTNAPPEGDTLLAGDFGTFHNDRPHVHRAMSMYSPDGYLDVPLGFAPSVNLQPLVQPDFAGLAIQQNPPSIPSSAASSPYSNASPPSDRLLPPSQLPPGSRKRPSGTATSNPTQPLLQSDVNIEDILVQTFVRRDGQGLFFGMIPDIPPLDWDVNKLHHLPVPVFFQDFHSAHRCWDTLMDRALQFYRRTLFNRTYSPATSDSPASIARQFTSWQKQLSSFETTFQPILDSAIRSDGTLNNPAALVISLYLKCTSILLANVPRESEMVYDAFLPDFKYIVRTCHLLISSQEEIQLPRNPRFSFETGVIPPLHIVATKCRDPITRREAVDLLWSNPRQEGMWDSILTARIGRWLISAEEEGLAPPELPVRTSSLTGLWGQGTTREQSGQSSARYMEGDPGVDVYFQGGISRGGMGLDLPGRSNEYIHRKDGREPSTSVGVSSNTEQQPPRRNKGKGKAAGNSGRGWVVPEGNRVQLRGMDFRIPDRCIKVKAQKVLLDKDGVREEREAVIAW